MRTVKATSLWGMESVLGLNVQVLDIHTSFTVVNIYDPYMNRVPFWEALFNNPLLRRESITCPSLQNNFMFLRNIMLYFM